MSQAPDMSKIAGGCVADGLFPFIQPHPRGFSGTAYEAPGFNHARSTTAKLPGLLLNYRRVITAEDADRIARYYQTQGSFAPVSVQGMALDDDRVGSNRITCWDPQFARALWSILGQVLTDREMQDDTATDWWQGGKRRYWKPVGISPMTRFMKYTAGGEHYAHYDAGFIYPDDRRRTLMSGVLYLTSNSSGATRFIRDGKHEGLPAWERDHRDWPRQVKPDEVEAEFLPEKGSVILFDHRLCHDVAPFDGLDGDRIIIRFDVEYEAV